MYEITRHKIEGYEDFFTVSAIDEPDHEKGGGAHHRYLVTWAKEEAEHSFVIRFQQGPIKEFGVNGLTNEALLAIVIHRLECFEAGPFACLFNRFALFYLKKALRTLKSRTKDRIDREVEGRNIS